MKMHQALLDPHFSGDVLHATILFFLGSLLNGTVFLKLMLGKVGESELIFVGIGEHWEFRLWFWSKTLLILSPLSAWVANDVSGRRGQEWCSWAHSLVTVPFPMLDYGQAQKA